MKKKLVSMLLAAALIAGNIPTSAAAAVTDFGVMQESTDNTTSDRADYQEGEVVVMFDNGAITGSSKKAVAKSGIIEDDFKVEDAMVFDTGEISQKNLQASSLSQGTADDTSLVVSLISSESYSTQEMVDALKDKDGVKYVEPNYTLKGSDLNLNDTYASNIWQLDATNGAHGSTTDTSIKVTSKAAWGSLKQSSKETVVAVIDSGADYTNEDLINMMWHNPYKSVLAGEYGYDFFNMDADPMDDNGHGTHCSGIIAAQADNGVGVAGVSGKTDANVKIMALKFLGSENYGEVYSAVGAYNYISKAIDLGVNVKAVNNSWGGQGYSEIFDSIIDIIGQKGALSIIAAGNESINIDDSAVIPGNSSSKYAVTVASTNEEGDISSYSNYGKKEVDIAAPGTNILSTVSYNNYIPYIYTEDKLQQTTSSFTNFSSTYTGDTNFKGSVTQGFENEPSVSSEKYLSGGQSLKFEINNSVKDKKYIFYLKYDRDKNISEDVYESMFMNIKFEDGMSGTISPLHMGIKGSKTKPIIEYSFNMSSSFNDVWYNYMITTSPITDEIAADYDEYGIGFVFTPNNDGADYTIYLDSVGISKPTSAQDTVNFGTYDLYSGTSMASPLVAGATALTSVLYPNLSAEELKAKIFSSITQIDSLKDSCVTDGILDLSKLDESNPVVDNVTVSADGKTIKIKGSNFGDKAGSISIEGSNLSSSNINWSDTAITISNTSYLNKLVDIKIIASDNKSTTFQAYLVKGKKEFTDVYTDKEGFINDMVSDGKNLYVNAVDGEFYKYDKGEFGYIANEDSAALYTILSLDVLSDYDLSAASITNIYGTTYCDGVLYEMLDVNCGYRIEKVLLGLNIATGKWNAYSATSGNSAALPALPKQFNQVSDFTLASYNGKLYMFGGMDYEGNVSSTMSVFDPSSKKWSSAASLAQPLAGAKTVQYKDKLYALLGAGLGGEANTAIYAYNGNKWEKATSLPTILYNITSIIFNPLDNSQILQYQKNDASIGICDKGIIIAGLSFDGYGDTIFYNISTNKFESTSYNRYGKIADRNTVGASVGNEFYLATLGLQQLEGYTWAVKKINISSGLLSVKLDNKSKYGYIEGIGSYIPGDTVRLKAVAEDGCYFKKLVVDSKTVSGNSATFTITKDTKVSADFGVYVTKLKLSKTKATMKTGTTLKLKATVNSDATSKKIKWTSSNKKYATVNSNGVVTAKSEGDGKTVTIKAVAADTNKVYGTCKIKISNPVTKVTFKEKPESITAGEKLTLKVIVTPANATNKKITWTTSNKKYATVNSKGVVTAKKAGIGKEVKITATAKSGKKAAVTLKIKK